MASIGRKPPAKAFNQKKRLLVVQVGALLAAASLLFVEPALRESTAGHEIVETVGFAFVLACVGGRLWSILYVGGRKNSELVSVGPFSVTRNPLYFFSTMGAVGTGLMFGSIFVAMALGVMSFIIFRVTALKEAEFLAGKFGATYQAYALRTPRFWPNPFLYRDQTEWNFSPAALKRTFFDGLYFLALFPVIEFLEHLRAVGILPAFFAIY
jgi:protein-S-isoprenylcysteine O-methyltransferase Ste14